MFFYFLTRRSINGLAMAEKFGNRSSRACCTKDKCGPSNGLKNELKSSVRVCVCVKHQISNHHFCIPATLTRA